MRLDEQVVVVTGANGGMGSALVAYLKGRARHVVACIRGQEVDWRPVEDNLSYVTCDLTDRVTVNFMVAEIIRSLEGFHAWINGVGGYESSGPVEGVPPEAWPRMFDLNFITCLNACQAILPLFKEQQFGRIINFGSLAGEQGLTGAGPYAMSKAAVHSLTMTIAQELSGGVTANLIVPAVIDTPTNRKAMPDAATESWTPPEEIAVKIAEILDEVDDPPNGQAYYF